MTCEKELTILILEDNPADVYLLREALHKAEISFTAVVLEDGESAVAYIDQEVERRSDARVDLAILDLNVPRRDGSEVLAHIRRSPKLRHIVVIILSSSPKRFVVDQTVEADCYIEKPSRLDEFLKIGERVRECIGAKRATQIL